MCGHCYWFDFGSFLQPEVHPSLLQAQSFRSWLHTAEDPGCPHLPWLIPCFGFWPSPLQFIGKGKGQLPFLTLGARLAIANELSSGVTLCLWSYISVCRSVPSIYFLKSIRIRSTNPPFDTKYLNLVLTAYCCSFSSLLNMCIFHK